VRQVVDLIVLVSIIPIAAVIAIAMDLRGKRGLVEVIPGYFVYRGPR
jgi:hypothetical protein